MSGLRLSALAAVMARPKMEAHVKSCPPMEERKYRQMVRASASEEGSRVKAPGLVAMTYWAQEPRSPFCGCGLWLCLDAVGG